MKNATPSQLQIDQAVAMLNEICQRVSSAREVFAHLRSNEDRAELVALADSLCGSLDVVGLLADSAAQKIGGASGKYFQDPMEWVMPPVYQTLESNLPGLA